MTTTIPANVPSKTALDFFNASADMAQNLCFRWKDESQYEDINDYLIPLKPIAEKFGVTLIKMNKRPFGFNFSVDGRTYQMKATLRSVEYKRIA